MARWSVLGEIDSVRRVWQAHARRLAALDPLLPTPSTPDSHPSDTVVLEAEVLGSEAVGIWERTEVGPTDFQAAFGPLRQQRLSVLLDGPDRAAASAALLRTWREALADLPADDDAGAIVMWPARDVDGVASLVQHGFFCDNTLAVRRGPRTVRGVATPVPGVRLRAARLDDIDAVCALQMEELIYDDRLGGMRMRPSTERSVRSEQVAALSRNDGSRILAERDGHPIGLAAISLAPPDEWLDRLVQGGPVGYLECLSVTERERSNGVGQLLAESAHRWADAAGAEFVALHHAVVNPYSTRFWNAQGYRPLWIRWSAPLARLQA